jgi:glucan phosphoethanolaminetransferase (alkaline phosphatase superfamily)
LFAKQGFGYPQQSNVLLHSCATIPAMAFISDSNKLENARVKKISSAKARIVILAAVLRALELAFWSVFYTPFIIAGFLEGFHGEFSAALTIRSMFNLFYITLLPIFLFKMYKTRRAAPEKFAEQLRTLGYLFVATFLSDWLTNYITHIEYYVH